MGKRIYVEALLRERNISFKEVNTNVWLVGNKYYISAFGKYRKKGDYRWYEVDGTNKIRTILNKLYPVTGENYV